MTTGRYTFIKLLNNCEFEWMTCEVERERLSVRRGHIKTHFPENINMMLRYEHSFPITASLWDKIAKIKNETPTTHKS